MTRTLTGSDKLLLLRLASTLPVGSVERKAILAGFSVRKASLFDLLSKKENEQLGELVHGKIVPEFLDEVFKIFTSKSRELTATDGEITRLSEPETLEGVSEEGSPWSLDYPSTAHGFCFAEIDISPAFKEVEEDLKKAGSPITRLSRADVRDLNDALRDLEGRIFGVKVKSDLDSMSYEATSLAEEKGVFYCEDDRLSISDFSFELRPQKATLLEIEVTDLPILRLKYEIEAYVGAEFNA